MQAVVIVLTCGGYLAASSLLILLNKFLLSTDGFAYPLMLSGSGMLMTFLASSVLVRIPALVPDKQARSCQCCKCGNIHTRGNTRAALLNTRRTLLHVRLVSAEFLSAAHVNVRKHTACVSSGRVAR